MNSRRNRILREWRAKHADLRQRYKALAKDDGRGGEAAVICRQMRAIEHAIRKFSSERIKTTVGQSRIRYE